MPFGFAFKVLNPHEWFACSNFIICLHYANPMDPHNVIYGGHRHGSKLSTPQKNVSKCGITKDVFDPCQTESGPRRYLGINKVGGEFAWVRHESSWCRWDDRRGRYRSNYVTALFCFNTRAGFNKRLTILHGTSGRRMRRVAIFF